MANINEQELSSTGNLQNNSQDCLSLEDKLSKITTDIASLILVIDTINFQDNPRLLCEYASKIGLHELALLEAQISARRAKRKLQIANSLKNKDMQVIDDDIEQQLEEEFAAWLDEYRTAVLNNNEALAWLQDTRTLTKSDTKLLKETYKVLMKRLHPDLLTTRDEAVESFFNVAQHAYENGDLETLQGLLAATEYLEATIQTKRSAIEIEAEIVLLEATKKKFEEKLNNLRSSYPYILKHRLASQTWVGKEVKKIKALIDEQNNARLAYEEEYKKVVKDNA